MHIGTSRDLDMKRIVVKRILFIIALIASVYISTEAQRRVVVIRKPSNTVVVTRVPHHSVVYVNRRVVSQPLTVVTLPPTAIPIVYCHTRYYYHAGYFYVVKSGGYIKVNPPAGIIVSAIPPHHVKVVASYVPYFYANGFFYKEADKGYQIVEPPAGAQIDELPEGTEKVTLEGKVFYEHHGTLYKKVELERGFVYEVSGTIES